MLWWQYSTDSILYHRMRMELLEIRRKFGVLLVGITHDPADVEVFGDTLVVFEDGRVREVSQRRRDAAHSDCLRHHEVLQAA